MGLEGPAGSAQTEEVASAPKDEKAVTRRNGGRGSGRGRCPRDLGNRWGHRSEACLRGVPDADGVRRPSFSPPSTPPPCLLVVPPDPSWLWALSRDLLWPVEQVADTSSCVSNNAHLFPRGFHGQLLLEPKTAGLKFFLG